MKSFIVDINNLLTVAAAVIDLDGTVREANAGFLRLLPPDLPRPVNANIGRYFIQPTWVDLLAKGEGGYVGLMTIGQYDGKTRSLRGQVWRSESGMRVLAEYDIEELERVNEAFIDLNQESTIAQDTLARANVTLMQRDVLITEESLTDQLTGVGNRRRLDQELFTEIARARRDGTPLSVIMADVDHFKRVNDEHGHVVGDMVLARFGALLQLHTRSTDIVTRYGGEEFILLLPNTPIAMAMAKSEQLRRTLASEPIAPLLLPVTSSFGVAQLQASEGPEELLKRVDAALYAAKEGGRNRVSRAHQRLTEICITR